MQGYLHTESFEICLLNDYVLSRLEFVLEKKICVILSRRFVVGQSDVSHGVFRLPEPSCADDTWREDSEQSTHKSASHKNTGIARTHSGTHWNTWWAYQNTGRTEIEGKEISPFSRGPCVSFTFLRLVANVTIIST